MLDTPWSEEAVETLKRMHKEGASGTEIGIAIGKSRNAVIGKIHRLKLPRNQRTASDLRQRTLAGLRKAGRTVTADQPKPRKAARNGGWSPLTFAPPKTEPEPYLDPDDGADVSGLIGIMDLTAHTCRFPIGDPLLPGYGYCGKPPREGSPYCEDHHRRTHAGVWTP